MTPPATPGHPPSDLTQLTLAEAAALVRSRAISPVELTQAFLTRIERLNPTLNAYITVTADQALQQARAAESQIQGGDYRGPLHGLPLALKDLIDTAGVRTTAASAVFAERVPTADAEVVTRLKAAGAVLLGKLNLHEFAYGGSSVPSHFGAVRNPWNRERVAGGSSGGSAAAVAAGLCLAALGTDTAASIRQPAAYCGVVGLKATYGLTSTRGVIPLSWSLDHVGPLCRSALDAGLLLAGIAGYDPLDPASVEVPVGASASKGVSSTAALRLGIVRQPYFEGLEPDHAAAVAAAIHDLSRITAGVRDVRVPHADILMTIASAEAYAYHRPHVTRAPELYQPMTRERLTHAARIPAADYIDARRQMDFLRRHADEAFAEVDLVITPTTAIPPIRVAEGYADPPLPASGTPLEIRNTHMFDVLGLPAISVPCGFTRDGMPIGLQIAGPRFGEGRVLALANAYQDITDWHRRSPVLA